MEAGPAAALFLAAVLAQDVVVAAVVTEDTATYSAVVPPHHPAELPFAVEAMVRLCIPKPSLLSTELLLEFQGI